MITAIGFLVFLLFVLFIKYMYTQVKLLLTKPWHDTRNNVTKIDLLVKDYFEHSEHTMYKVNDIWYFEEEVEESWDECKISEPISTLLTLILTDYDNFVFEVSATRRLSFNHKVLNITTCGVNELVMFDNVIPVTDREAYHIQILFEGLKGNKKRDEKVKHDKILEESRINNTDKIVAEMNRYLEEK